MALTKKNQRIAIAKDVLKQIAAEKLIPADIYCAPYHANGNYAELPEKSVSLQKFFKQNVKTCKVCAIGAAFVSAVNLYNECESEGGSSIGKYFMSKKLRDYFDISQINLLEKVYECWDEFAKWSDWCSLTREQRLVAIMKNIIKNDGRLVIAKEEDLAFAEN